MGVYCLIASCVVVKLKRLCLRDFKTNAPIHEILVFIARSQNPPLNAQAYAPSVARGLHFGLSLHQHRDCTGRAQRYSDETAHLSLRYQFMCNVYMYCKHLNLI